MGEINNNNNTPGTLDTVSLKNYITMYLNDIESYGTENELTEATNVLNDFVLYINSMSGMVEGQTNI